MKMKLIGWGENDITTRWGRRYYTRYQRAGVCKDIKRGMNRRERHKAAQALREGRELS